MHKHISCGFIYWETPKKSLGESMIILEFTTHVPVLFWPDSNNFRDIELKLCVCFITSLPLIRN